MTMDKVFREKALELITDLMIAISNCSLYSQEHAAVLFRSEKAAKVLERLYIEDKFSIVVLGRSFMINNLPFSDKSLHLDGFIKKLKRKGIDKVIISRGVTADEIKGFVSEIAFPEKASGKHPHISFGIVEVKLKSAGTSIDAFMDENRSRVKEAYHEVSRFRKLDIVGLEDVVMNFISTVKQEANILRVVSPVKSFSEYTYTHNVNVAVLAIFQAESLRLRNEALHDIGLAGLLHDVGKMFTSREVLDKETRLTDKDWEEMRRHPVYGATYLASLPEVPKYALIAAYEHHMKFNGEGYPDTRRKGRRQHLISQIIAIADFFDALRSEKPYRRAFEIPEIFAMMKEFSGKDFNPILVDNFTHAIKRVIPFTA